MLIRHLAPVGGLACLLAAAPAPGFDATPKRTANDGNVVLEGVPEISEQLVARLNRYQSVRSATFQDWTQDGSGMYVRTRFGETAQIHHVAQPGGARRQITFFSESR